MTVPRTLQCLHAFEDGQKEVVMKLLSEVHQPHNVMSDINMTFVHFAARHGWHDTCQTLVENYHLSPTDMTVLGHSPLHFACAYGRAQVVKYLLKLPTVLLSVNDEDRAGMTALNRACVHAHLPVIEMLVRERSVQMPTKHLPSDNFAVVSLLSSRIELNTEFFIGPHFRVFMTGNSAAGKTTLATVMLNLAKIFPSQQQGLVSGIKTLTAGICPTTCSG